MEKHKGCWAGKTPPTTWKGTWGAGPARCPPQHVIHVETTTADAALRHVYAPLSHTHTWCAQQNNKKQQQQ
eukprot:341482-Chlamydomonas_euryale.AAC.3